MRRSTLIVLATAAVALSACSCGHSAASVGASSAKSSTGSAAQAVNVAQFCQDYDAASAAYLTTAGDVTDPSFTQVLTLLAKAKAEAPPAIEPQVAAMYATAVSVQKSNGTGDLTSYSQAISDWEDSHCPTTTSGNTTPSDTASTTDGSGNDGAAGTASSGTADLTGFCPDVWDVTDNLTTLDTNAISGGAGGSTAPSASDWQSADAAAHRLAAEAPATAVGSTTAEDDANTVAGDVDDITANGFDNSNGGANLQQDVGVVQTDAIRLGCPRS